MYSRDLKEIRAEAVSVLQKVSNAKELEAVRVEYFGRKGKYTLTMKAMAKIPASDRPAMGNLSNQIRNELTQNASAHPAAKERACDNRQGVCRIV